MSSSQSNASHPNTNRNYGIDLLRLVSMYFVLILHSLGIGGVLKSVEPGSAQYMTSWFLEIFTYGAVDIFALISGYVSYSGKSKKTNFTNYVLLWFQVVIYGLIINFVGSFFLPEAVTAQNYYMSLLPVSNDLYWYFTAYTGLFAIIPLLNICILHASEKTLRKSFVVLFLVFSVFNIFCPHFVLGSGYSFVWISLLYIIGAIIKKCHIGIHMHSTHAIIGIFLLCFIAWLWKMFGYEFTFLSLKITKDLFVSYTSPAVLGTSILFLICFSKLNIPPVAQKAISFSAPCAFAAYLLNNHVLIWNYVMTGLFEPLKSSPSYIILFSVLSFSLLFLIFSILVDKLRALLFNFLHIRQLANKIVCVCEHAIEQLAAIL